MAVAKTLFRATIATDASVADVAGRMNRELARDNERLTFVTAIVGRLDLRTGHLAMVDAGHNPVAIFAADGSRSTPALEKGIAFGVLDDAEYSEATMTLDAGTTVVVYTDGATDARNPSGEQFGEARLDRVLADAAKRPPDAIVAEVAGAVERFESGAPPEDDLTLLALRYHGAAAR
jgi:sigma-B regulation protein RsbU (phosphoserine phosphatase)